MDYFQQKFQTEELAGLARADAATNDVLRTVLPPLDWALFGSDLYHGKASGTEIGIRAAAIVVPGVSGVAGRLVSKAETPIARAVRLGVEGERAAGIIGSKSGILINGRMRFPDEVSELVVKEVKNVARQGWTKQLKDYSDLAKQIEGRTFELWVRAGPPGVGTRISEPLKAAAQRGDVVIRYIGKK